MSPREELPEPGTLVRLAVGGEDAAEHGVCTVLSSALHEVVLEAPARLGVAMSAPEGTPITIGWATMRGLYALAAVLATAASGVAPWRLQPQGEVELLQRRRFARASVCTPLAVVPVSSGASRAPVGGWLVDLGEGGARAFLERTDRLEAGARVEVHLTLEGEPLSVTGRVRRVGTGSASVPAIHVGGPSRLEEVVLGFEEPVAHAQQIRRAVLREQVRARRTARPVP